MTATTEKLIWDQLEAPDRSAAIIIASCVRRWITGGGGSGGGGGGRWGVSLKMFVFTADLV